MQFVCQGFLEANVLKKLSVSILNLFFQKIQRGLHIIEQEKPNIHIYLECAYCIYYLHEYMQFLYLINGSIRNSGFVFICLINIIFIVLMKKCNDKFHIVPKIILAVFIHVMIWNILYSVISENIKKVRVFFKQAYNCCARRKVKAPA